MSILARPNWYVRSPPRLGVAELSPLSAASAGSENDTDCGGAGYGGSLIMVQHECSAERAAEAEETEESRLGCSVVLDPLPSALLESLGARGHVTMTPSRPPSWPASPHQPDMENEIGLETVENKSEICESEIRGVVNELVSAVDESDTRGDILRREEELQEDDVTGEHQTCDVMNRVNQHRSHHHHHHKNKKSRKARRESHDSDGKRKRRKRSTSSSSGSHCTFSSRSEAPKIGPSPRVNPIFVWVTQSEESTITQVLCEDYDIRNRIRLTKTPNGWRAIPRTERLSVLQSSPPSDQMAESDTSGVSPVRREHAVDVYQFTEDEEEEDVPAMEEPEGEEQLPEHEDEHLVNDEDEHLVEPEEHLAGPEEEHLVDEVEDFTELPDEHLAEQVDENISEKVDELLAEKVDEHLAEQVEEEVDPHLAEVDAIMAEIIEEPLVDEHHLELENAPPDESQELSGIEMAVENTEHTALEHESSEILQQELENAISSLEESAMHTISDETLENIEHDELGLHYDDEFENMSEIVPETALVEFEAEKITAPESLDVKNHLDFLVEEQEVKFPDTESKIETNLSFEDEIKIEPEVLHEEVIEPCGTSGVTGEVTDPQQPPPAHAGSLKVKVELAVEPPADLSSKRRRLEDLLPCRSPALRLPPLPARPLPSPVLGDGSRLTPSPAHQQTPCGLPPTFSGTPQTPSPAHHATRPFLETLLTKPLSLESKRPATKDVRPAKRHKPDDITLRTLLGGATGENPAADPPKSRLLELLTTTGPATAAKKPHIPPPPCPSQDALSQLRQVLTEVRVPDPLLVPQSRLAALLAGPRQEITRLVRSPPPPSADMLAVSLSRLQALLKRPDSELLAWAAQDWAAEPVKSPTKPTPAKLTPLPVKIPSPLPPSQAPRPSPRPATKLHHHSPHPSRTPTLTSPPPAAAVPWWLPASKPAPPPPPPNSEMLAALALYSSGLGGLLQPAYFHSTPGLLSPEMALWQGMLAEAAKQQTLPPITPQVTPQAARHHPEPRPHKPHKPPAEKAASKPRIMCKSLQDLLATKPELQVQKVRTHHHHEHHEHHKRHPHTPQQPPPPPQQPQQQQQPSRETNCPRLWHPLFGSQKSPDTWSWGGRPLQPVHGDC